MNDALAVPGTVVLLGGTSDIGLAIVGQLVARGARTVVPAGRDRAALQHAGERLGDAKVHVLPEGYAFDLRSKRPMLRSKEIVPEREQP